MAQLSWGQKKQLEALRVFETPTIDGELNEALWAKAPIASNFIMFNPDNGKPAPDELQTEVKVIYTDEAIYIGAFLYDHEPQKILKEIAKRDDFGTADHFGVFINGFNDGQQDFRFFVSAAGVQMDGLYTESNGEDYSWDAIWRSAVKVHDKGWSVELRIPYAALRFSAQSEQTWGLNFYREVRRHRRQYSWNWINTNVNNVATQSGELTGLKSLKTPTRLFFIPYVSNYLTVDPATGKTQNNPKGGMDIKYGINDAFTLDAILIPDFGQTKFDNVELNLSPYEQQFSENRPFFNEGIDLFSKGNLFYSRRIGQVPSVSLNDDETLLNKPSSIKLLNALKISGRTSKGLGIGVLNAITETTRVDVLNSTTNLMDRRLLSPLTNYSILVLDQRFRKNSSISWVNTSVMRNGSSHDAWVSGLMYDLNTKANTYNLSGDFKYSLQQGIDVQRSGVTSSINFSETSGNYRYSAGGSYVSRDFDTNDLGIQFQNRYHSYYANASYRTLNPVGIFNSYSVYLNNYLLFDNPTGKIQDASQSINANFVTKTNDYFGGGFNAKPIVTYDFYEPRSSDRSTYLNQPANCGFWLNFSSNYNRAFALDVNPNFTVADQYQRYAYTIGVSPRYRFNNHFSLVYNFSYTFQNNNIGFTGWNGNEVVMARRNRITYNQSLQGKYAVNHSMSFNLLVRHYWSFTENKELLRVQSDGNVTPFTGLTDTFDSSFNTWNLDLYYSWWFIPGSQMTVMYRNYASQYLNEFGTDYSTNINQLFAHDAMTHVFSLSIRYFLDYNVLKKSK